MTMSKPASVTAKHVALRGVTQEQLRAHAAAHLVASRSLSELGFQKREMTAPAASVLMTCSSDKAATSSSASNMSTRPSLHSEHSLRKEKSETALQREND
jgi:hypothetical protein